MVTAAPELAGQPLLLRGKRRHARLEAADLLLEGPDHAHDLLESGSFFFGDVPISHGVC